MGRGGIVFAVFTICLLKLSSAWIHGGDFSKSFDECSNIYEHGSNKNFTQGSYEKQCTDLLLPLDKSKRRIGNFTTDQLNYITSLVRQIYSDAYNTMKRRIKRTAGATVIGGVGTVMGGGATVIGGGGGGNQEEELWRIRTEIRYRNGRNFNRYANAVQRLKKAGSYDVIADVHSTVITTAHFGPNLLPWHRLYLMVMETALGVPVPYWDASLDYNMKDPTASVVWTEKYFGNGYGPVRTGPFANFKTPAGVLFRKINAAGRLLDREAMVRFVWRQRRLGDISTGTAPNDDANLEGQHNNVHAWVNGIMGNIALSSHDPIFFCFHAMFDAIYEIFRWQQQASGINPEFDFVKTNIKGQRPEDRAGINGYYNRDGYLNRNANKITYRLWAQCASCDDTPDVYCDFKRMVCVSRGTKKKGPDVKGLIAADNQARESGLSSGRFGPPFPIFVNGPRVRGDPVQQH